MPRLWRCWGVEGPGHSVPFQTVQVLQLTRKPRERVWISWFRDRAAAVCMHRIRDVTDLWLTPGKGRSVSFSALQPWLAQSRHYEPYSWVVERQIDSGLVQTSFQPSLFTASGREVAMTQRQQQTRKPLQIQSLPPLSYHGWHCQSREFTKTKKQAWAGGACRMQRHTNQISACQYLYLCAGYEPFLENKLTLFSSTIRQREVPRGTALSRWQASMNQTWSKVSRSGLSGHYISLSLPRTVLFLHEGTEGEDIIWGDNGWSLEHPVHCSKEQSYFRRYPQPSFLLF